MAKEYSQSDILRMQQEAMHRVQEMQARAQRTLNNANANGGAMRQNARQAVPHEMEERIRQNDAPRPQQQSGQPGQLSPKHTRLPVEFSRPVNTQGVPPQGREQNQPQQSGGVEPSVPEPPVKQPEPPQQHTPHSAPQSQRQNRTTGMHHQISGGQRAQQPSPSRQEPRNPPPPMQQRMRSQQNRNMPMHHGGGKPVSGLAGLFGSSGDFIKNIMADKDLMMVLGMVWLLSGEEKADQSLIMSLLYIIM